MCVLEVIDAPSIFKLIRKACLGAADEVINLLIYYEVNKIMKFIIMNR